MANDVTPPMHSDFPRWYREVGVDENRERLQRRWAGISALVRTMTAKDVETALEIVFRVRHSGGGDGTARIRQAFKDADELFDMQGNDREMEVLCGTSLATLLERNDNVAASGALAVTTSEVNGARTPNLPMSLAELAEIAIARIAEANRKRPDLRAGWAALPKLSFNGAKEKLQQQFDAAGVGAAFDIAAGAASAWLESFRKQAESAAAGANKYIAIQDEELEMLWWVLGERSESLNQSFKEVPPKAQPLVFAKELADATNAVPGPMSVKGMLTRAGLKQSKKVTIPEAVNGCPSPWLNSLTQPREISPLTTPIHFAIQRKLETNDDTSWVSGWAAICGIDEKHSFSALSLGNLFYRERLLTALSKE